MWTLGAPLWMVGAPMWMLGGSKVDGRGTKVDVRGTNVDVRLADSKRLVARRPSRRLSTQETDLLERRSAIPGSSHSSDYAVVFYDKRSGKNNSILSERELRLSSI
eukprot:8867848-Pyramimonas_sp.AAC.1